MDKCLPTSMWVWRGWCHLAWLHKLHWLMAYITVSRLVLQQQAFDCHFCLTMDPVMAPTSVEKNILYIKFKKIILFCCISRLLCIIKKISTKDTYNWYLITNLYKLSVQFHLKYLYIFLNIYLFFSVKLYKEIIK